jgi:hypothetical protein
MLLMSQGEESSGLGSSRKWQTLFLYSRYVEAGKGEMNLTSFSALDPHGGRSSRLVTTHRTIHCGTSVRSLPSSSRALVGVGQKHIHLEQTPDYYSEAFSKEYIHVFQH